jgi:hypothetical protein
MPDDNFEFLVIGAGRSGTSLLAGLLDFHDRLEVGFEQFSEGYLMGAALATSGPAIFDDRVRAFLDSCRDEARRYPGRIYGNKITTEQLFGLEDHNTANPDAKIDVFDRFFNHFMKGRKIVFVLRDGRTCVRSKVARTGQSVELACDGSIRSRFIDSCGRAITTRCASASRTCCFTQSKRSRTFAHCSACPIRNRCCAEPRTRRCGSTIGSSSSTPPSSN